MKVKGQHHAEVPHPRGVSKGGKKSACQSLPKKTLKELRILLTKKNPASKKKLGSTSFSNLSSERLIREATSTRIRPKQKIFSFKNLPPQNLTGRVLILHD